MNDIKSGSIIGVHKPVGPTSHDMIDKLRRITGIKKIGHAGTLDPLASGVLVVAVGREATKRISEFVDTDKEYVAEITLGMTSSTDDEQGEKTIVEVDVIPNIKSVESAISSFIGHINQTPPIYSAIKVQGKPAHRRVRQGQDIELKPRKVVIHSIELLDYSWQVLRIKVTTGKGVYIRSLARDIGKSLGTGGYLSALERTRVGEFDLDKCVRI